MTKWVSKWVGTLYQNISKKKISEGKENAYTFIYFASKDFALHAPTIWYQSSFSSWYVSFSSFLVMFSFDFRNSQLGKIFKFQEIFVRSFPSSHSTIHLPTLSIGDCWIWVWNFWWQISKTFGCVGMRNSLIISTTVSNKGSK